MTNRFGGRLFWHFFKSYTEKVWGIPCNEIRADWAAQRIKNLSLRKAVWNALSGSNDTQSLIEEFDYPRLGPGMMWEAFRDRVRERGGEVRMKQRVRKIHRDGRAIRAVEIENANDGTLSFSRPISLSRRCRSQHCINNMVPPAPAHVQKAAAKLNYRDFLIVTLIMKKKILFPDNWIYIHSPEVQVGRIQNFRSWSADMLPDSEHSSIGWNIFATKATALGNAERRAGQHWLRRSFAS